MSSLSADTHAPVASGELVLLDYDLWAEGGGRVELIDTTREETAQEQKLQLPEGHAFGPRPHLIGGEYFPAGIESALPGAKLGEEFEREFTPAEAFGERDPKMIELFSMHEISRLPEMRREDAHLDVGTVFTIRGRRGRVVSLTAARVRGDFNPPFFGRKVKARFRVTGRIGEPAEQVKALVELNYGRAKEFHVEVHDETITLKVPERSKFDIAWMAAKPRVIDRIRSQLKPHSIRILEEYLTPTPKGKEGEKDKSPEETSPEPAATSASTPGKHPHPTTKAPSSSHSREG